jgi:type I restriction enzyme M protein
MTQQNQELKQTLWNIANNLRGNMDGNCFKNYTLGFILYKYLSEEMELFANEILEPDNLKFHEIDAKTELGKQYLEAIKDEALDSLGYFLNPNELFSELANRGNKDGKSNFILDDLAKVLASIEQSTMGNESEDDFSNLFKDLDLTSSKLGKTENAKNELIVKVLSNLNEVDFDLENSESDILGDAYEYLIGIFANGAEKNQENFTHHNK